MVKQHAIKLHTPFYADPADGTMLHRYLDEQFIPRFLQEAGSGKLKGTAQQRWRQTDRFGKHALADKLPSLRLPLHRAFHVVSCEVSCDLPGNPAWDPARIVSAGFVVRRGTPASSHIWQVRDGVAQGWQRSAHKDLEPDEYRRLLQRGLIQARVPEPLFSGEQNYPLHHSVVTQDLGNGNKRTRTLLYGFLPLGGNVDVPLHSEQKQDNTALSMQSPLAEHEWPFGCWDGVSAAEDIDDDCTSGDPLSDCCGKTWDQQTGLAVNNGTPTRAFVQMLRTLLERYHVYNAEDPANEALRSLLDQVQLRTGLSIEEDNPAEPDLAHTGTGVSLLDWIEKHHQDFLDAISNWQEAVRKEELADPGANPDDLAIPKYPLIQRNGLYDWQEPAGRSGWSNIDIYITRRQAETLRELLAMRMQSAMQQVADSLPVARYQQGEKDIYFVKPFVRYKDECGNEKMAWGPESKAFRVASPLDPEAVRPTSIQLPELDDVKRGLAKGVTFITPSSLANQMEKIKPDLDFKKQGKGNLLGFCANLTISFSIPVITICAMILLMIIINLLNIFLRWIPWAILKLPRCP